MKQLLYLLCLLLLYQNLHSQSGVEFWFVAPDVSSGHADRPISLRISTFGNPANVTIEQPANGGFTPISLTIAANNTSSVDLTPYIDEVENAPSDSVRNFGLHVYATTKVACYYEIVTNYNTDIFVLKAENALGTEFMIPMQSAWKSGSFTPDPVNTIDLVATENGTSVTITPTEAVVGHAAGVPYTITLNRGETYAITALGSNATDKLGGTVITSTRAIAVTVSDDSVEKSSYGNCRDILGDQMIPLDKIGNEYIVMKGFLSKNGSQPDRVYVLATQNSTTVQLNGGATTVSLNQGDQHEIELSDPTVYILADKDVYVMHVTGFGCEVGAAILPSVYCTGSQQVSFTRSREESFYMIVLVPTNGEQYFEINGSTTLLQASDFSAVTGTSGNWMAARKYFSKNDLASGQAHIVTNSQSKFHLGIINGGSKTGCMYGYFSEFSGVTTDSIYHF